MRIKKFDEYFRISEDMNYHIDQNMSILDNVFRPGSGKFFALLREARSLYEAGRFSPSEDDRYIFAETSIGEFFESDGKLIPLDLPMLNEEAEYDGREVDLNKPMRSSGPKKYKVYVQILCLFDEKSIKLKTGATVPTGFYKTIKYDKTLENYYFPNIKPEKKKYSDYRIK